MRTTRVAAAAAALAAGVLITLTGCTGIPTSGQVNRSDVQVEAPATDIEFLPASPVVGDSPEGILRGFIDAASSPQNDYAVAREFLSSAFNADWDPNANVTIDGAVRDYQSSGEATMVIRTDVQAMVDAAGNYTLFDTSMPAQLEYTFVTENGEWRIASAPQGVLLERFTFDQVFGQHALYFFDPTFSLLVPDLRYFPSRASTPTRIMKALLAGPSPWLAQSGAVVTAFPAGTALVAETVPITGTSASVDLTATALDTTAEVKRRMLRQAVASLASLSSIFTVQLSIDGVPQDVSSQSEDLKFGYPQVDSRPMVIADGKFGFLQSTGAVEEVARVSPTVNTIPAWAAAYSDKHHAATVNTTDGLILVRSSGSSVIADSRADLAPGVFDYYGYVWSVPRAQPHDLFASTISGVKRIVTTPWPDDGRVISLALSRDGTRIGALIDSAGSTKLYVSGVTRDGQNGPVSLGTPLVYSLPTGAASNAAWVDPLTIGTISTLSDGNAMVTLVEVGGQARTISPGVPGLTLAAGNNVSEVFIRAGDGSLYAYRAVGRWPAVASGVAVQAQVQ